MRGVDLSAKRLLLSIGLIATFFPCIVYAQNKQRYEHLARGQPDPERGGSGLNGDCLLHGCITCCFGIGCVLQVRLRTFASFLLRTESHSCYRSPSVAIFAVGIPLKAAALEIA